MNASHWAWACISFLVSVLCAAQPSSDFVVLILFKLFLWISGPTFWFFGCLHSECEIVRDACTFMPLIHQLLCEGLCVFFFVCLVEVSSYFGIDWTTCRTRWTPFTHNFTACVKVWEEGNTMVRNSCHCHWASNAPTVGAVSIHRQAWLNIADTAHRLGHRVQIPGTPSPCHWPVITPSLNPRPLGFLAIMIP